MGGKLAKRLNVFIYKMFHASAEEISLMVSASAVTATVTTVLMGAFSDYIGKRKLMVCGGYILWGISILTFALVRVDVLTPITPQILTYTEPRFRTRISLSQMGNYCGW